MGEKIKILLTEPLIEPVDRVGLDMLRSIGEITQAQNSTEECLVKDAADVDAIVVRLAKITSKIIKNAPKLKVIARTGVGVDNIDVESATENGVYVVNLPAMNADSVAEHVFCFLLALAKNLTRFDFEVAKGNWKIRDALLARNHELLGKTLGIVGFGSIGARVASRAKVFGMKIVYFDIVKGVNEAAQKVGALFVDLKTLLKDSDFVTVHVPLTEETRHMFGEEEFRLMKNTAYFVNTSRGSIVDQKALLKALEEGYLAGAALDVYETEPPAVDDPIVRPGVILKTPHVAGFTKESRERMIVTLAEDVLRVFRGESPVNLVNRKSLGRA
ncbi:MAG: hydroxyacid dehydrogenase [Candidatus Bathyarchaeota archaeon]|nr:MAG: hydroxyacid dehydrogenase [Candidatus Bathyarchaeota archaeon]